MKSRFWKKMMICFLAGITLLNSMALKCGAQESKKSEIIAIDENRIDDFVDGQMKDIHIPGLSIGIIRGDQILYEKGYGKAKSGQSVSPQTPFSLGSVSKSFTSLAIMQLKEKGLIDLDASIQEYMPWIKISYHKTPAKITVRQLLYHSSGVPMFHDNDAEPDATVTKVTKEHLNNLELLCSSGGKYMYSNANYILLGGIIEAVTNISYKEYIKRNIFIPLEMKHSYVDLKEAIENDMADGYTTWFGIPIKKNGAFFQGNMPSGHIISCAEDMCHFLSIFVNEGKYKNKNIVSLEGIKELLEPGIDVSVPIGSDATNAKYAMGWLVTYKNDKIDLISHVGENSNYHACAVIDPDEKLALIQIDNLGGYFTAGGQIGTGIMKSVLNQDYKTQKISNIFLTFNLIYIVLAVLFIISILRLRSFPNRVVKNKQRFVFNIIFTLIINIVLPILIPIMVPIMWGASWKASFFYTPDMCIVLISLAIILFVIGIIKSVMILKCIDKKDY